MVTGQAGGANDETNTVLFIPRHSKSASELNFDASMSRKTNIPSYLGPFLSKTRHSLRVFVELNKVT